MLCSSRASQVVGAALSRASAVSAADTRSWATAVAMWAAATCCSRPGYNLHKQKQHACRSQTRIGGLLGGVLHYAYQCSRCRCRTCMTHPLHHVYPCCPRKGPTMTKRQLQPGKDRQHMPTGHEPPWAPAAASHHDVLLARTATLSHSAMATSSAQLMCRTTCWISSGVTPAAAAAASAAACASWLPAAPSRPLRPRAGAELLPASRPCRRPTALWRSAAACGPSLLVLVVNWSRMRWTFRPSRDSWMLAARPGARGGEPALCSRIRLCSNTLQPAATCEAGRAENVD